MFRTASRSFAASVWRRAEPIAQPEAFYQHAINVSKAQGIAQRALVDGEILSSVAHFQYTYTV